MQRPMRICGPSASTVTRATCSSCKMRSRAGSRSRSTWSCSVRKPPGRPSVPTCWTIFSARAAWNKPPSRDRDAEAISLYERALALNARSVDAQSWLAVLLAGRVMNGMSDSVPTDIERAQTLATRALAVSPRSALAHLAKAQVLRAQNRPEEATPEYEAVIAFNRNWPHAIAALGWCKLWTGSLEEAILLQEQAIRISPRDPLIGAFYLRIGQARLLQSRTDEAIVWLERARNVNHGHPHSHAWLAAAYVVKGETERAAVELAEARKLSSDDRYSSLARLNAMSSFGLPKVRALSEATFFA